MDPRYLTGKRKLKYPLRRIFTHGRFIVVQSLALLSLGLGQQAFADTGRSSDTRSVSIHLVGVVQARLEMNFTFSTGNTVDLVGHGEDSFGGFEVSPGASRGLGFMNVKSNLLQGYTITAYSSNGGTMKNLGQSVEVPYKLRIDDRLVESRGGVFKTDYMGKSSREGDSKFIAIQFGDVPEAARDQVLVDRLTFSISAN